MYKPPFGIGNLIILGILVVINAYYLFSRLFSGDIHAFDYFIMTFAAVGLLAATWSVLEMIKGRYILEKDEIVIKAMFKTSRVPYAQIKNITTGRPRGFMRLLTGVKDLSIELDLGKENPLYIATSDQEGFLAELKKLMRIDDSEE